MNKIVIQTALSLEQESVLKKLSNIKDYENTKTGTVYKIGTYTTRDKNTVEVIVGRTDQTNINAAIETERIINLFEPTHIFFVGVAGGLKDVQVGDIVIGRDVFGYERGKNKEDFYSRPQFGFSSYELEQKASTYKTSSDWIVKSKELLDNKFHTEINIFSGTIASGEKVVGSKKSELFSFLKKNCSHALAVEMEGLGFLEACRPYPLIKSLIVRGISDLVDGKENSDELGSQPYASRNATEFLFGLLDFMQIDVSNIETSTLGKLSEIAPKLYPSGLRENTIWKRAGGDLSVVNLFSNGKTQWIEALLLIDNGGGGDIDFNRLIEKMKEDFPNNDSLKKIKI